MLAIGTPSLSAVGPPVVTVTDADAVCVVAPDVPVMVNDVVPAAAVAFAVTVSTEVFPAVTVAGENDPVTPLGNPEVVSVIACVLPFTAVVVTVYGVELPLATDADAGDTATVKSGAVGGVTLTDTAVEWLPDAAVPVTVTE
jgi:hypothetical protein